MIFLQVFLTVELVWVLSVVNLTEVGALIPEDEPIHSLKLFPGYSFAGSAGVGADVLEMSFLVVI